MIKRNIPEVTQTSAMDCGPAVLASLLAGFGASISYPRLREACQTDVDGTSIDTLEELANRFGLCAEQVVLPNDFILEKSSSNLPCIAIVTLPNGLTHFVVLWRQLSGFVQIMDPARGRSWMRKDRFLDQLYQHRVTVPAADWLEYAQSDEFKASVAAGLQAINIDARTGESLMADAFEADTWESIARFDAAVRMCRSMHSGRRMSSTSSLELLRTLLGSPELLSDDYFQVIPDGEDALILRGAVIVRMASQSDPLDLGDPIVAHAHQPAEKTIIQGLREMYRELGMKRVAAGLVSVSLLVGLLTFIEALVFRYLIGSQPPADLPMLALIAFIVITPLVAAVALEAAGVRMSQIIGRCLSTGMHARLLRKLPRMADGYFSSRLVSDLAERGHAVSQVREIPELVRQILIVVSRITLLLAGLTWLLPELFWLVIAAGAISLIAPVAIFPTLAERDLRIRTHLGALSRFYLDSLLGSEAIWAHGAAPSVQHEQESLLLNWAQAVTELQRPSLLFEGVQVVLLAVISIALVSVSLETLTSLGTILLVAYWSLFIPILSLQLTQALKQLPSLGNVAQRVLELLDAPEEEIEGANVLSGTSNQGVGLQFRGASIRRGDVPLIEEMSVAIEPGERIAIVGASGSGKSSFIGAILGWNTLDEGELVVDGIPMTPKTAAELREQTVVIDPDLYLWNKSLFDNIRYGRDDVSPAESELAMSDSELLNDLKRMDEGLATKAGEDGSRLSGGEGQRLRIARGLIRSDARLVLLDEPFTGMDSEQRRRMRRAILDRWPDATMLFVSHNVKETAEFHRVLVFDQGRIIEDGVPATLLKSPGSIYSKMLEKESALLRHLQESTQWRHQHLDSGQVVQP